MKPVNMVATILPLILAGANSGGEGDVQGEGAAHAQPARKRRIQNVLKSCDPEEPAVKNAEYAQTQDEGYLPSYAVGEHSHTGGAYHETHQAPGYNGTGQRVGRGAIL